MFLKDRSIDLIDQLRYNIPQYVKNCLSDMNTSCYDTNQKKKKN